MSDRRGPGERSLRVRSAVLTVVCTASTVPGWLAALSGHDPATVAVAMAYVAACAVTVPLLHRSARATRVAATVALVALGAVVVALVGLEHSWALLFALCVGAVLLPTGVAIVLAVPVLAATAAATVATGAAGQPVDDLLLLVSVPTALALVARLADANTALRAARDEVAALAAVRERERFARDLHDLLGHHLTTVTLRAGVARRLLESDGDRARVAAEVSAVEHSARDALRDVRAAVSGYREMTLAGEVAVARATLDAAGIEADLPQAVDGVRPELRAAFGFVLREATTNALRHARAQHVRVRLGPSWIEVRDDGVGAGAALPGNGLRGLEERLEEVGALLITGPAPGGGFLLRATLTRRT